MGNSTPNGAWEDFLLGIPSPSAAHQASLSPDAQPLDSVSFSDTGDLAEPSEWFTEHNMASLATIMEDNPPYRTSIQKQSKIVSDAFSPRRGGQFYVPRSEFAREIRGLTEKLDGLRESLQIMQLELQKVAGNHEKLSRWTIDIGATISDLAHQVVEKIGVQMAEENEWHMPGEEQLQH
ncbi:hypothetical protein BGZ60DRAFT_403832 [Tricladium varicosporioides]|nr:hypothetical protein BGZ60DRAFT_403832 [Hymenoscyphus varicosporioides]